MFIPFTEHGAGIDRAGACAGKVVGAGILDTLLAFEGIGARRSIARNAEIFAEGDPTDCWFRVISGAVRLCKLLPDGRRHVAEFYFGGDCFGLDNVPERLFTAEAIGDTVIMRYPRADTERLIDRRPELARGLRDMILRDLANARGRMLLLCRMSAPERVATFILDMLERRGGNRSLELPMPRSDIADYLGLTIETVCRLLSAFKRAGAIEIPMPHRIELRDRAALVAACEV